MGPFEMVVAIVAITAIASVIRARYGVVRHAGRTPTPKGCAPRSRG